MTRVLVVNTGSSSLKLATVDEGGLIASTTVERWEGEEHLEPLREFLERSGTLDAVGHRIVHSGPMYDNAVRIDDRVLAALGDVVDLAPLHMPRSLAAVRAVATLRPDVAAVACFDTSFHSTIPPEAATYAVPREWNSRFSIRRYGFHGLSHRYASRRAADLVGRPLAELRTVTCHLGAGCSLAAIRDGRSVDTTMGFTPLEGLAMVTRSGSIDPGLILWLQRHAGMTAEEIEDALEHHSGLAGLSGTSGDLRDVLAARASGDPAAALAYAVFCHRLARETASMVMSAGGLDLLVFTGGIGEGSPEVRADLARRLDFLGVSVDQVSNDKVSNTASEIDRTIDDGSALVRVVVVHAREELEVARETRALLRI
jgi:acetate kinase